MIKKRIFVFILLASLLLSLCTARAQVVHEDPDRIPVRSPYDADKKLALALQEMFGSLDSFAAHLNASDFEASREDIARFSLAHVNFTAIYERSGLSGSDMEAIASQLASMEAGLLAAVGCSENYSAEMGQFEAYLAAGDSGSAARAAARMHGPYRDLSGAVAGLRANSTLLLRLADNGSVDTAGLEGGIVGLDRFISKVDDKYRRSSGLLGNASLALHASSGEVASGDRVALTAALAIAGGDPSGRLIRFYVDGLPAGSASTDPGGVCTLVYEVDGRSFNRTMRARAELDPGGEGLCPATSNVVEIRRRPERAVLQVRVAPGAAAYADTLYVYGTLATLSGTPAARQAVAVSVGDRIAGLDTTGEDGSFAFRPTVGYDVPAGACRVAAAYESPPDSALMGAVGEVFITVSPLASVVTLDPQERAFTGGAAATFGGTLASGAGVPVAGAGVRIFADDVPLGAGLTNASGRFGLTAPIPYDIAPGVHAVYASFDPGAGRALAGSRSEAIPARFEPLAPQISVSGIPWVAFPGEELTVSGTATAGDGRPLGGLQVVIAAPGAGAATATTDTGGAYQLTYRVAGGPGIYRISASVRGSGLVSGTSQGAGVVLVMPLGRAGMAVPVVVVAALVAGLAALKASGAGRKARRVRALPPLPASPAAAMGAGERAEASGIDRELRAIGAALSGSGDRREAMRSIYLAARRMLRARDPGLPDSATHRELCRALSARHPSLAAPIGVIARGYEGAAFGHLEPTDEEVRRSLRSLQEIMGHLYGDGGVAR